MIRKHVSVPGRYLLFVCDRWEPIGGWGDFNGWYDTVESAMGCDEINGDIFSQKRWCIVDSETWETVIPGLS